MDYEINNYTLMIYGIDNKKSKIYESSYSYDVDNCSNEVVEHSCEYFGSTLEGRQCGTKALIGVHKSPIFIEETANIIFFPIKSPRNKDCTWVSFNNVKNYCSDIDPKKTIITFKNGKNFTVSASFGTIQNQILRSSRLQVVLNDRKIKKD